MAEPWVINASPVILLAKAGLIQHVPALAQALVIPEPVAVEIRQCREADAAVAWINGVGAGFIRPPAPELPGLHKAKVGFGERAVIAWAVANPGFIAVLDDAGARSLALQNGVRLIGTVGVVLKLKKAGIITEAKTHLLRIRQAGGFIGDKLLREALLDVGEQL